MANPSVTLGEPLIHGTASRSIRYSGKALTLLSFAIGLGLTVLLGLLQWANISDGPHSAINMASIMPQQQRALGTRALPWQSRPLPSWQSPQLSQLPRPQPPFQPGLSRQRTTQVSAFNPQPFGTTKDKFTSALPKILPPLFQSFIIEYLGELHFYVFSQNYKYDALFALGLREFFNAGSGAYDKLAGTGEGDNLWSAICAAVGLDGEQISKDAETMTSYAKSTQPADILKQMTGDEKPSDPLVASAFEENPKHSQFRSIGLFKIMEFSGLQIDKDKTKEWATASKIDYDKLMKDLQLFRTSLRRIEEGEKMMKDMMDRREKVKSMKKAEKK